jgi:hypothetical protein
MTLVAADERVVRGSYRGETRVNVMLSRASYAASHTGPSAISAIEGVLIRGAQGVRTHTVAFIPRPSRSAAPPRAQRPTGRRGDS